MLKSPSNSFSASLGIGLFLAMVGGYVDMGPNSELFRDTLNGGSQAWTDRSSDLGKATPLGFTGSSPSASD